MMSETPLNYGDGSDSVNNNNASTDNNNSVLIAQLQQQVADMRDENFFLSASLATVDAERTVEVKEVENLRRELRLAKREVRLQQQPQQPKHKEAPKEQIVGKNVVTPPPPATEIQVPRPASADSQRHKNLSHATELTHHSNLQYHLYSNRSAMRTERGPETLQYLYERVVEDSIMKNQPEASSIDWDTIRIALQLCPQRQQDEKRKRQKRPRRLDQVYQKLLSPLGDPDTSIIDSSIVEDFVNCVVENHLDKVGAVCVLVELRQQQKQQLRQETWATLYEKLRIAWHKACNCLCENSGNHPRRLLHPHDDDDEVESGDGGTDDNDKRPVAQKEDWSTTEWCQKLCRPVLRNWMAAALELFALQDTEDDTREERALHASVTDILEYEVLPQPALFHSKLALACIFWLRSRRQLTPLQMPTTASTDAEWKRGRSVVGICTMWLHKMRTLESLPTDEETIDFHNHIVDMDNVRRICSTWERTKHQLMYFLLQYPLDILQEEFPELILCAAASEPLLQHFISEDQQATLEDRSVASPLGE